MEQSTTSSLWSNAFLGQFDSLWNLQRALGSDVLHTPTRVQQSQGRTSYGTVWPELETAIHNPGDRWVGGQMRTAASPRDPVFYLHHAWIDLLWARWQAANPGAPFVESQAGAGTERPAHGVALAHAGARPRPPPARVCL